jgi:2-polyprenyl-3-methyl-5-hydroxy-6-metoxy-1,4-benzoquinol methylase
MHASAPDRAATSAAIRAAYEDVGTALGRAVTDEMAVPAYLFGKPVSRYVFWRKLDIIIRAAALRPDTLVLDFGCGTGILLPRLSAAGRRVIATDLHLEIARRVAGRLALPRVQFISSGEWAAQAPDAGVQTIIAANVLEHIADRQALLRTFQRKLTPAGRLVISGPTENRLYRFGRRLIGFSGAYHVTTVRECLADAEAVGLRRVYRRRWPLPGPGCLYVIAAYGRGS